MTNVQPTGTTEEEKEVPENPPEAAKEEETSEAPKTEGAATPATPETPPETMESLMAKHEAYEDSFKQLKRGEVLTGKVVQIGEDGVMVDVGYKTEGVIPLSQLSHLRDIDPNEVVSVGDEVRVVVKKINDSEGTVILSKKQADLETAWIRINDAYEKKEIITGTCTEQVKGGLIVDLGLRGFVPASHVDTRPVADLSDYVGESLSLKVLEIDRNRRKVVLSRKKALEEERSRMKEKTMSELEEGQIIAGTVARLTNFGAFVNLGGVDGLVHISELAWKRIKHPNEVVRVGEDVEVRVLGVDRNRERISLSLKQARPDPWTAVLGQVNLGDIIEGRVTKLAKNYVFVEIVEGVEGLVPLSELSEFRVSRPSDVVRSDQDVKVKVIDIKPDQRRITLSLRQAQSALTPGMSSGSGSSQSGGGQPVGGFSIADKFPDKFKAMVSSEEEPEEEAQEEAQEEAKEE